MTAPFGDFEFTVGSVRGLRSWSPEGGALRAVSRRYAWQPGENTAHCFQTQLCDCAECRAARDAVRAVIPHRMETCECGFYAYFVPQIDVTTESYVSPRGQYATGVIEAYGRTIVGTKGFRAERARILAVAFNGQPTSVDGPTAKWHVRAYEARLEATVLAARAHGVPLFESVEQLLAEFPTSSADEFRQEAAS